MSTTESTAVRRPRGPIPHTPTWGLALTLATALISGVAVFLNSYGVKAFGNASLYTTVKNVVAALLLGAVAGAAWAGRAARSPVAGLSAAGRGWAWR